MRAKLEAVANVAVIVLALAVGYLVLAKYVTAYRTTRSIPAGDRLAKIPGLDWDPHRRTLVLALSTGCHYCQESVPFYQKLAQAQGPHADEVQLVAVFPNDPEAVRQFTKREGLYIRSVPDVPLKSLRVVVTPTLIMVDADGRVEQSWIGELTAREELDVMKAASASLGCSQDELAARQAGKREGCNSGSKVKSKN
jgi:thiol-disulfide isomerase/thioredoxin